ncbi:pyridoxamine 5'-phosphate oxidase [Modestobacter sp. I12A-02628]|uniref:Pyridoxamine 5'-phosphate oxidase family protein n=1 Tax=Goekera deserti TaxID=2497753 RepID=A0A7K3WJV2_9ACTN|nr:pyridoxamine 5'-phosphate oxidase family protein [Goekera deserti]MPQ98951.1 pyridoxamine 5'-phosphate oxidase [Goekera deserti]NDI49549.1 pyridoxamine 5'-phosphate oxidase family protein [Goekera deserti]NEL56656.1 pyridoxamine 5'-phosphate oxidase family protein [Goekera deserti]
MTTDQTRKVAELIKGEKIAMLTTRDETGRLGSRPMALQEVEFDGDLWFFAERDSGPVATLAMHPQVNVSVGSSGTWVSVAGTAVIVDDPAKKEELWNAGAAAWLPQGPEDDSVVLIKVEGETAEYWDTPGRVSTALSFAKATVTGERYSGGENETVVLH